MPAPTDQLLEIAHRAVKRATAAGATAADAYAVDSENINATMRLGLPEGIESSAERGLGIRVFVGKSYATVSTEDMRDDAIGTLIDTAIAMAKQAPEDAFAGLADPALLARELPELDVYDTTERSMDELLDLAKSCEDAGRSVTGITNSEGASASTGKSSAAFYASSGAQFTHQSSHSSLSLSLIAGTGDHMQRDYSYATTRFVNDLPSPEAIAHEAAMRTLDKLSPQKLASQKIAVIFDPRVGKGLLGAFAGAINGAAIARGTSFLKDALGARVFAPEITVIDDPLLPRGLASQPCDDEGVRATTRTVIEKGMLTTWFLDTRSANQLGLVSTGHAHRSLSGSPSPSASNLYIAAGVLPVDQFCAQFDRAFYVTETFGHGVNLVTGDYSQGASGFLLEKGARVHPVSEVTIAGNLRAMFANLSAANDLSMRYAFNVPTLAIPSLTVAGS